MLLGGSRIWQQSFVLIFVKTGLSLIPGNTVVLEGGHYTHPVVCVIRITTRGIRSADLSVWEAREAGCCARLLAGRGKWSLPRAPWAPHSIPLVVACHECQGGHVPGPHTRRPVLARTGATSPSGATVPAVPDAEESGDVGAIFVLFLLRVHDKGLKLMFRKTKPPTRALPLTRSEARWPPWESPWRSAATLQPCCTDL